MLLGVSQERDCWYWEKGCIHPTYPGGMVGYPALLPPILHPFHCWMIIRTSLILNFLSVLSKR